MKLIKPSFEIIEQGQLLSDVYRHIEICGRTCYKSEDKMTPRSAFPFVERMIASQHYAMLEHGTIYLILDNNFTNAKFIGKYINNKYSVVNLTSTIAYITTNLRVIVENGWSNDLKLITTPMPEHRRRVTVKFTCNRQVSHEFVRHRVFSFAQESTRYCNYTKGKFGGELTFIEPCWEYKDENNYGGKLLGVLQEIENRYFSMINSDWKPQQAATILPNALKTELIMTGFVDDWKHFFDLRAKGTTGAPHPQAKELAEPLMNEFVKRNYI